MQCLLIGRNRLKYPNRYVYLTILLVKYEFFEIDRWKGTFQATLSTEQQPLPEPSRLRHRFGANLPVIETWIAAGSLHGFPEEDILLRCSGYVTDCLNIYNLYTYVMLTPTRIVVKEASTFFKFNLYTTEASYRYKDVRHVSVERVTQFKFLWAAISLFSLGIILLALSGINIVACALGLVSLFYAIMFLYWFHIYYNAHSVVINFSKDAAVGAWSIPKGKGSYLTKPLLLPVKDCFDVMYKVFDQAKLFKIDEG